MRQLDSQLKDEFMCIPSFQKRLTILSLLAGVPKN